MKEYHVYLKEYDLYETMVRIINKKLDEAGLTLPSDPDQRHAIMTGALNLYEKALTSYYAHMFEKTYEEVAHLVHVTMGTVQDQWLTNDEEGRDIIRAARKNCLEVVEETLKFELR